MFNRNQFNIKNYIYKSNTNENNINADWKKRKKYFYKTLTIQNSNYLPNETLSFSNETVTKNNENFEPKKKCIMERDCPYYNNCIELKSKMNQLSFSVKKIKALNEILITSLEKQNILYQSLINENKNLKEELFLISSQKKFLYLNNNKRVILSETNLKEKNKKNINIKKFLEKEIKSLSSFNLKNIFDLKENSEEFNNILTLHKNYNTNKKMLKNTKNEKASSKNEIFAKSQSLKNIYPNNNLINNKISKNYYNLINEYTNQQNLNFISDKMKRSFLCEDIDYETLLQNNRVLKELILLTKSEKEFISKLSNASTDIYHKYYDTISLLINDYKEILKLGLRLKDFTMCNITLLNNMDSNNSIKILLKNICSVLSCEKANIYILDNISDSLILYSSDDSIKYQKRLKKDEGIIGSCFTENKKIRIDEADKSILCYPLIDKNDNPIGVIEAINKFIPPFNNDDEELVKLLSYQVSTIFKNFSTNNDNLHFSIKLNDIINYIISLINIKTKFEFTEKTEKALLTVFNCSNSKFYFVEDNKIIYYNNVNKEKTEFDINMGIIGKVIKIKNIYGIQNIKHCIEYNTLVDIDSFDGILTIPILERKTKKIKGVAQIPYIGTIDKNNKPKDVDCKLIKKLRKGIKYWIYYHSF